MKFDNIDFKKNYDLDFRFTTDDDKYVDGTPMPKHFMVILNKKTGEIIDGLTAHSLTNKLYGSWKKRNSTYGIVVEHLETGMQTLRKEYYQLSVYLVKDGKVYVGSIKRAITPRQLAIIHK